MRNLKLEPDATSRDRTATPAQVLAGQVLDGLATILWHDRLIRTRHADISVRQTSGAGMPILFLHGGGLCKESFQSQLESDLGSRFRVIAIDFPGHGASSDPFDADRTYSLDGLTDLAREVLDILEIERAVVVGASLGARVGLRMIRAFPGLIGLALTGTPLSDGDRRLSHWIASPFRGSLGDMAEEAFAHARERTDARAREWFSRESAREKSEDWPAGAVPPIMVLNGAEGCADDAAAPDEVGSHYVLPLAGPAPYLDADRVYNHLLLRFMRRMEDEERGFSTARSPSRG